MTNSIVLSIIKTTENYKYSGTNKKNYTRTIIEETEKIDKKRY